MEQGRKGWRSRPPTTGRQNSVRGAPCARPGPGRAPRDRGRGATFTDSRPPTGNCCDRHALLRACRGQNQADRPCSAREVKTAGGSSPVKWPVGDRDAARALVKVPNPGRSPRRNSPGSPITGRALDTRGEKNPPGRPRSRNSRGQLCQHVTSLRRRREVGAESRSSKFHGPGAAQVLSAGARPSLRVSERLLPPRLLQSAKLRLNRHVNRPGNSNRRQLPPSTASITKARQWLKS